jgi:hypothetical protein
MWFQGGCLVEESVDIYCDRVEGNGCPTFDAFVAQVGAGADVELQSCTDGGHWVQFPQPEAEGEHRYDEAGTLVGARFQCTGGPSVCVGVCCDGVDTNITFWGDWVPCLTAR